jgi:hypothetical protein
MTKKKIQQKPILTAAVLKNYILWGAAAGFFLGGLGSLAESGIEFKRNVPKAWTKNKQQFHANIARLRKIGLDVRVDGEQKNGILIAIGKEKRGGYDRTIYQRVDYYLRRHAEIIPPALVTSINRTQQKYPHARRSFEVAQKHANWNILRYSARNIPIGVLLAGGIGAGFERRKRKRQRAKKKADARRHTQHRNRIR